MFERLEQFWAGKAYETLSAIADEQCQKLLEQKFSKPELINITNESKYATFQRVGAFVALIITLLREEYKGNILSAHNYNYFLNITDIDISHLIKDLNNWKNLSTHDIKMKYMKLLIQIFKIERESGRTLEITLEE